MGWPPKNVADFIEHGPRIAALCEFAEEMMKLRVLSNTGGALLRRSPATRSYALDQRGTQPGVLPDMAGNALKVLGTDGVNAAWVSASRFYTGVRRTAFQSIPNVAFTSVIFDQVESNEFSAWDAAAPTRVTITADGLYLFSTAIVYANNNSGVRYASIVRNASAQHQMLDNRNANTAGNPAYVTVPVINTFEAGEFVELQGYQDTGGALNISGGAGFSFLRMVRLGDIP